MRQADPAAQAGARQPGRTRTDEAIERQLAGGLAQCGVGRVDGPALARSIGATRAAWRGFAAYWDRLVLDPYMGDGGRYRYRRYGAFAVDAGGQVSGLPHAPYRQSTDVNPLNGGIDRHFDPLEPGFAHHPLLGRLVALVARVAALHEGAPSAWNAAVHPYRIVAGPGSHGKPTPEGLHRDGVDYIVSMMVGRRRVRGGTSQVTDSQGRGIASCTLRAPLDLLLLDDVRTMHEVSPVTATGAGGWRDVLVFGLTRRVAPA